MKYVKGCLEKIRKCKSEMRILNKHSTFVSFSLNTPQKESFTPIKVDHFFYVGALESQVWTYFLNVFLGQNLCNAIHYEF